MMKVQAPIGVFDSGLGGLTALRQLQKDLPDEDFIYFGDTARVPYGGRDKATLTDFARSDIALLQSFGVKAILVACGTVSSVVLEEIIDDYDIPLVGVIGSAAEAAARATRNGKVGIWGTEASIRSGAYAKRLEDLGYADSVAVPCPKLVPLIESGTDAREAVREYLAPILAAEADTLILGCTHYPLLKAVIAEEAPGLALIDSGAESGLSLRYALEERRLLRRYHEGTTRYIVSGNPEEFEIRGGRFLNRDLCGKVEQRYAGK
ncbi:MAG: glutamate racemase [Clostridia bacterium]|nr:glutamate racemase [Clostridia bacterium]